MTDGRIFLPFAKLRNIIMHMVEMDLPFAIWCLHDIANGRCIYHLPGYHLPVIVPSYHLPLRKNLISTMWHLPSVYAPKLIVNDFPKNFTKKLINTPDCAQIDEEVWHASTTCSVWVGMGYSPLLPSFVCSHNSHFSPSPSFAILPENATNFFSTAEAVAAAVGE